MLYFEPNTLDVTYKKHLALMPVALNETPRPENHCAKVYRWLYNTVTSVLTFVQYINDSYSTAKLYILYKLNKQRQEKYVFVMKKKKNSLENYKPGTSVIQFLYKKTRRAFYFLILFAIYFYLTNFATSYTFNIQK